MTSPPPSLAASSPSHAVSCCAQRSADQRLALQSTSYVSRRRLDAADFDPDETDNEGAPVSGALPSRIKFYICLTLITHRCMTLSTPDVAAGLPLVYNEAKIAAYWSNKPGELARRWAKFARISGLPWSRLRSSCWRVCGARTSGVHGYYAVTAACHLKFAV